jgi:hypothetical protein
MGSERERTLYITCDSGPIPVEREDGTPARPVKEWLDNGIHMRMYHFPEGPIVFVDYPSKAESGDRQVNGMAGEQQ